MGFARLAPGVDPAIHVGIDGAQDNRAPVLEQRGDVLLPRLVPDLRHGALAGIAGGAGRGNAPPDRAGPESDGGEHCPLHATTEQVGCIGNTREQHVHALEARVGVDSKPTAHGLDHDLRHAERRAWRAIVALLERAVLPRRAGVWTLSVDRLVQGNTEAELISGGARNLAEPLLGRHVPRRSDHRASGGELGGHRRGASSQRFVDLVTGRRAGESEVRHPDASIIANEYVGRLEVAVHESGFVRRRQAAPRFHEEAHSLAPRSALRLQPLRRGHAIDELHRDIDLVAIDPRVVDLDDVGV